MHTVYPKKYAHGFCFAVLCCGYTLTDFPISIRLTSLALWQSNDCPSASKTTLMNMDKYFMWIYYERLHNHNKAKHNKTVCIFLGIYCMWHHPYELFVCWYKDSLRISQVNWIDNGMDSFVAVSLIDKVWTQCFFCGTLYSWKCIVENGMENFQFIFCLVMTCLHEPLLASMQCILIYTTAQKFPFRQPMKICQR